MREVAVVTEPSNPDALLDVIRDWFRLLAAGQLNAACEALDEPNSYGIRWTPSRINAAIEGAFGNECRFRMAHPEGPRFTDPDQAVGNPEADIFTYEDGRGFRADHDVPLNGMWSELTAQFEFLRRPQGLVVILHDLHVL
jgi:hypothetical protein